MGPADAATEELKPLDSRGGDGDDDGEIRAA